MKSSIILIFLFISLNAQTTLCFKNNYQDLSNIESQPFNGGKCEGKYSIKDLVSKGWEIKDIKIKDQKNDSYNFIYILSLNDTAMINDKNFSYEKLIVKTKEYDKKKKTESLESKAKKTYENNCKSCHGKYGEKEAYGTSDALNTLSKNEFEKKMISYRSGDLDNGNAFLMRPSASIIPEELDEYLYNYIVDINKKRK